jgi:hypothetical protein
MSERSPPLKRLECMRSQYHMQTSVVYLVAIGILVLYG